MRILRTLFILASLLAAGCQADRLSKGGDGDVVVVGDKTILTLSSPTTRVHLGEKSGEKQYRTY